ncbi:hypothetical protein K502DRAFT_326372 [Neoconidiobolus thromboides FSU 785]|nr:hypothetical protein K502DRAFT_326372 [Neoconidiobolus thromboides FSU 785]
MENRTIGISGSARLFCGKCNKYFQTEKSFNWHNIKKHFSKNFQKNNDELVYTHYERWCYPIRLKLDDIDDNIDNPIPPPPSPLLTPTKPNTVIPGAPLGAKLRDTSTTVIVNNEKRYTCHLCDKSFKQKVHLTRHIKEHSGTKPYSCKICFVSFKRLENYNQHVQSKRHQFTKAKLEESAEAGAKVA